MRRARRMVRVSAVALADLNAGAPGPRRQHPNVGGDERPTRPSPDPAAYRLKKPTHGADKRRGGSTMERMLPLLAASSIFLAVPSWAQDVHLTRPYVSPKQNVTVPVTKLPGNYIGCIIVPTPSMRALTGLLRVHAVACVEATTGEVIVAVLRKNGTPFCS